MVFISTVLSLVCYYQTQEDGQKDDSGAPPPRSRRRNYRPRQRSNDDVSIQNLVLVLTLQST